MKWRNHLAPVIQKMDNTFEQINLSDSEDSAIGFSKIILWKVIYVVDSLSQDQVFSRKDFMDYILLFKINVDWWFLNLPNDSW